MAEPPLIPEPSSPEPSSYDALLAGHLVSIPQARLFVGADLQRANWSGLEAAFGELLAALPNESILAVYDDSAFGRGAKGFVVTDRHLVVSHLGRHVLPLDQIAKVKTEDVWLQVTVGEERSAKRVGLRVDELPARAAVHAWLQAVVTHNRAVRKRSTPHGNPADALSVRQVLGRLEHLVATKGLGKIERRRVFALADRLREQEDGAKDRKRS